MLLTNKKMMGNWFQRNGILKVTIDVGFHLGRVKTIPILTQSQGGFDGFLIDAANILKGIINLKVLKKKADDFGKVIQVFTNDEKGKKLIQKAGLKLYQETVRKRKKKKLDV